MASFDQPLPDTWHTLDAKRWKSLVQGYVNEHETSLTCNFVRDRLNDLKTRKRSEFLAKYLNQYDFDDDEINTGWIPGLVSCDPRFALVSLADAGFPTLFHWTASKAKSRLFLEIFKLVCDAVRNDPILEQQFIDTLKRKDVQNCPVLDRAIMVPGFKDALEMVTALIDFHPDLIFEKGGNPLHRAASSRNLNLVKMLCSRQPRIVTMRDATGRSAVNSDLSLVTDENTSPWQRRPKKYPDMAIMQYLKRLIVSLDVTEEEDIDIRDLLFGPNGKFTQDTPNCAKSSLTFPEKRVSRLSFDFPRYE